MYGYVRVADPGHHQSLQSQNARRSTPSLKYNDVRARGSHYYSALRWAPEYTVSSTTPRWYKTATKKCSLPYLTPHNLTLSLGMLDAFEIITTSGVVLWSRSTSAVGASAVNSLINDVFIEEKVRPSQQGSGNPTYKYDKYTLKYTLVKDLGLIFVVRFGQDGSLHIESDWRVIGRVPIFITFDLGR